MTNYKILTKEQKKAETNKACKALSKLDESAFKEGEGKEAVLERSAMSAIYSHIRWVIVALQEYEESGKQNRFDTDTINDATKTLLKLTRLITMK